MMVQVEFGVVVVLDEDLVVLANMLQQTGPSCGTHGDAGGHLMARRHIEVVTVVQASIHHQPLSVDVLLVHVSALQFEDAQGVAKTGVLDGHLDAMRHQQCSQQVQRVLRAQGQQDFVGAGPDAPLGQHAGAQLFDEHLIVAVETIAQPALIAFTAQGVARHFAPAFQREQVPYGLPVDERVAEATPVTGPQDAVLQTGEHLQAPGPIRSALRIAGIAVADRTVTAERRPGVARIAAAVVGMQVVTTARAAHQIAVVQQAFVDQRHGIARDTQLLGQLAARRQRLIGRKTSAQNRRHQGLAQLLLQAALLVEIQVKHVIDHALAPRWPAAD